MKTIKWNNINYIIDDVTSGQKRVYKTAVEMYTHTQWHDYHS
jgi:hypothetical protein